MKVKRGVFGEFVKFSDTDIFIVVMGKATRVIEKVASDGY